MYDTSASIPYFKKKLARYGFGSCGPRGFLGTYSSHLLLEKDLEAYFDQPALVFSSNATVVVSSVGSVSPDYCVVFEEASPEISRLREQFRCVLVEESDFTAEKFPAPLEELVHQKLNAWVCFDSSADVPAVLRVAQKYRLRTLMNDLGFLVDGRTKRGTCERLRDLGFDVHNSDLDLVTASFEHVFGIPGGCCSGAQLLIGNMRTAANGYCFSASAPPALMDAVRHAMRVVLGVEMRE